MRTTGVRLIAETSQYKREMRESAKETRKVKDEIDETAKAGDKLGAGMTRAAKSTARDFDEMRKHAAALDEQIETTERGIRSLAKGFANSGDTGLLKAIREQQSQLRELKNVRSLLPDPAEAIAAGASIGGKIVGGIRTSLTGASPAALGAGVLGLALAPTVGGLVAGAVVGGAAGMGVIGGLTIAAQDDRVKAAGRFLGQSVMGDLERRSAAFIPEAIEGIDRIQQAWKEMGPDLDRIFKSSRFVQPLLDGALKGGRAFVSGFADAIDAADPVVQALNSLLSQLGTDFGDLFRTMGQDAKEGASALNDLTMAMSMMITATGGIIHGTAAVKGFSDELDVAIDKGRYWLEDWLSGTDALTGLSKSVDLTADGFGRGSLAAESYRKATIGTADAADFATLKTAGMTDAQISAADASGRYRAELEKVSTETREAAIANGTLVASQDEVKEAQTASTIAQQGLTLAIQNMAPAGAFATKAVESLKAATQSLYGAQMQSVEANEAFEASWDSLSGAVKENGRSLDIHTKAGRSNRDALQALLGSSRDMYFADIAAGVAVDEARKKHERRTVRIREEAKQLKLNKTETSNLINTYGKIPPKKETDLILDGVKSIVSKLQELYVYQRSLAEGIPLKSARALLTAEAGPQNRDKGSGGGYAEGGWTGPGHKHEAAGIVHADEFVIKKSSRRRIENRHPGLLEEMNATGQVPAGYASGGLVAPVDTSRRWPIVTDVGGSRIPSRKEVASNVVPMFSTNWPSSPSAQRGDSGMWRKIVQLIKSTGPMSGSFGNGYRPGDPKWHGSGRAVDWMGYNQDRLASYLAARRPLELIHRTRNRDYAYTRGRNKGSFNSALMEAHRNHIHIAMADGGLIREPILGVGASGKTYSFGENYRPEWVVPAGQSGAGGTVLHVTVENRGVIGSRTELDNWLAGTVDRLRSRGRM